jgi:hypothetical protein
LFTIVDLICETIVSKLTDFSGSVALDGCHPHFTQDTFPSNLKSGELQLGQVSCSIVAPDRNNSAIFLICSFMYQQHPYGKVFL